MNSFIFCRKYIFIFLIINFFNTSAFGLERNCLNYPYPEGIYLKIKPGNKKQLIYTKSVLIKNKNKRKIEFAQKKNNLFAMISLHKHIKHHFPNLEDEEIGIYNIYSCFDSDGIYKISYAQRYERLKTLNIFKKVKNFLEKKVF